MGRHLRRGRRARARALVKAFGKVFDVGFDEFDRAVGSAAFIETIERRGKSGSRPAPATRPARDDAAVPAGGCGSDAECKGDRICQDRRCVDPPPAQERCGSDRDCPGEMLCEAERCVEPSPAETRCEMDTDCPGELVCTRGRCGPGR